MEVFLVNRFSWVVILSLTIACSESSNTSEQTPDTSGKSPDTTPEEVSEPDTNVSDVEPTDVTVEVSEPDTNVSDVEPTDATVEVSEPDTKVPDVEPTDTNVDDVVEQSDVPEEELPDAVEVMTPPKLAQLCKDQPDDDLCRVPGAQCPAKDPLLAYAWNTPGHWEGETGALGSKLVRSAKVAFHQGGDPDCDWIAGNQQPDCKKAPSKSKTLDDLADELNLQPEDRRVVIWQQWDNEILPYAHPDDLVTGSNVTPFPGIWWDKGVTEAALRTQIVFQGLKERGIDLVGIFGDLESGFSNFSIGTCWEDEDKPEKKPKEEARWQALEADPRFDEALIAQLNDEFGLVTNEETPLQEAMCPYKSYNSCWPAKSSSSDRYMRFNALMGVRVTDYVEQFFGQVAMEIFPNAIVSNYGDLHQSNEYLIPDFHGHQWGKFSKSGHVGTYQSPVCYGEMPELTKPNSAFSCKKVYEFSAFNSFRYALNTGRAAALSAPNVPLTPWVKNYMDDCDTKCPYGKTLLWHELMFHMSMLNPDVLLYFNSEPQPEDAEFEAVLGEIARVTGCTGRTSKVSALAEWFGPYILSGLETHNRMVWRLTSEDESVTLIQEGTDLVASYADQTLIFPNAWHEAPAEKYSRGVWVLQHADAQAPYLKQN